MATATAIDVPALSRDCLSASYRLLQLIFCDFIMFLAKLRYYRCGGRTPRLFILANSQKLQVFNSYGTHEREPSVKVGDLAEAKMGH